MGTANGKGGRRIALKPTSAIGGILISLSFTMGYNVCGGSGLACGMHTWIRSPGVSLPFVVGAGPG